VFRLFRKSPSETHLPLAFAVFGCAPAVGKGADPKSTRRESADQAHCTISVNGKGTKSMEDDYLPHVITCENGGANLQALKAQAIAARSVAYYSILTSGSICDGQGCQVYGMRSDALGKGQASGERDRGTVPEVRRHADVRLLRERGFELVGTELQGKLEPPDGEVRHVQLRPVRHVREADLTRVHRPAGIRTEPRLHESVGCARLENSKGQDYKQILQFYYGKDIQIAQATGSCVAPTDTDGDGVSDDKDNCKSVDNAGQADADGDGKGDACDADDDDDGVNDEADNCPKVKTQDRKTAMATARATPVMATTMATESKTKRTCVPLSRMPISSTRMATARATLATATTTTTA
jgi:hypothetical protein